MPLTNDLSNLAAEANAIFNSITANSSVITSVGIGITPQSTSTLYVSSPLTADGTGQAATFIGSDSNTSMTAARSKYASYNYIQNFNQNKSSDGLTTYNSAYYGSINLAYNGNSSTGGDAFAATLEGTRFQVSNYANGSSANTVTTARGAYSLVRSFGSGVITSGYGFHSFVGAGNNSVTGNITNAYGMYSQVTSNTAMTIGTGYLYYGTHTGSTTTTKYGIYLTGETTNYLSGRLGIGVTSPSAGLDINLGSYDAGYSSIRLPNGGNYILLGDRGVIQGWPSEGLSGTYFGHNFVHQGGVGFKNLANAGYSGSYSGTSYWAVFSGASPGAAGTTFGLAERLRIDSSGRAMFGTTDPIDHRVTIGGYSAAWGLGFSPTGVYPANSNQYGYAIFRNSSGTGTGNISGNESSVTYSTSSDYRLKTNLEPLTSAVNRLKNIPVYRFNWLIDPEGNKVDGFLAHEVQEIVPQAVVGEKDAVFPDGKINSQSIDHSKLVPLLTAALQEAIDKIEQLESRIAVLES